MPRGCFVELERQAQKYILENIRAQLVNKNYLLAQLADFGQAASAAWSFFTPRGQRRSTRIR